MTINKNIRILLGGVLIVILIILAIRFGSKPKPVEPLPLAPIEELVDDKVKQESPVKDKPVVPVLGYTEAVEKYKGKRIQFDQSCQAVPAKQTFKVGTTIMFDNRSPKPATISLGSSAYLVEAYGYTTVTLTKEGLFTANCNSQRNVLTLTVQK